MAELTTSQLIKIILGIVVVAAVLTGLGIVFRNRIIDFFRNIPGEEVGAIILLYLRK